MIALIAGATGFIGNELLSQMLADSYFQEVRILVRKEIALQHPKLKQIKVNFDNLAANQADFQGVTHAFCCLGTTMKKAGSKEAFYKVDFTYCEQTANAAKKAGVTHFQLITSSGASKKSAFYYSQVKGEIEEYIQSLNFASFVILRPSLLMGERKESRFGERMAQIVMGGLAFLIPNKYKGVQGKTVAKAMLDQARINPKGLTIMESDEIFAYEK
jgi:uncharacterized protein YbjT (DUF2867 family)